MTEQDARNSVRAFIRENFLYTRPDFHFADEDSLLRKGVVDSLGVTEVIGFVEQTWSLEVPDEDVTEGNFGTVAGIARYVAQTAGGIPWPVSAEAGKSRG